LLAYEQRYSKFFPSFHWHATFLVGNWHQGRDFFEKACHYLSEIGDRSDYDIACVLMPLSWWARLYASNYYEGRNKQREFLTQGMQICEKLEAQNDETFCNLASMATLISNKDPTQILNKAKTHPPYQRRWNEKQFTSEKPKPLTNHEVHMDLSRLYGAVYPISDKLQKANRLSIVIDDYFCGSAASVKLLKEDYRCHENDLKNAINMATKLSSLLRDKIVSDQSSTRMFEMMCLEVAALLVFIHWAMRSKESAYYCAKIFVDKLWLSNPSIMLMATHELTTNYYIFVLPVDILAKQKDKNTLLSLQQRIRPYSHFYWLRQLACRIDQCLSTLP